MLPVALLALLAIGHTLYWRWASQQLQVGFSSWLSEGAAAGWTSTVGEPTLGGWPLAATLTAPDLRVKGDDKVVPGGAQWGTERLVLRLELLNPTVLEILPEGAQQVRVADSGEVRYVADQLQIKVPLSPGGRVRTVDLDARNLRADLPGMAGGASRQLTIGSQQLHLVSTPNASAGQVILAVAFRADAIELPADIPWPLGPHLTTVQLDSVLNGPLAPTGPPRARATAWRDGGGKLEIGHLALNWGPLDLSGQATLALDDQLQPAGSADLRLVGYVAALDSLAANRVINDQGAMAAKAVLSLLARQPESGGPPEVDIPLRLKGRVLAMRQMQLTKLPPLVWPDN